MDSLLANYASSDDDEQKSEQQNADKNFSSSSSSNFTPAPKTPSSSLFSSLPPPKPSSTSSSLFASLRSPKIHLPDPPPQILTNPSSSRNPPNNQEGDDDDEQQRQLESSGPPLKFGVESSSASNLSSLLSSLPQPHSSSLFSSLPQPEAQNSELQTPSNPSSSSDRNPPKKVVQFRPPINPSLIKSRQMDDEDEDDHAEEIRRKRSKEFESLSQTSSVKSFLSNIPAPKNSVTFGALPSASGSGRRSMLEADAPALSSVGVNTKSEATAYSNVGNHEDQSADASSLTSLGAGDGPSQYAIGGDGGDPSHWGSASGNYVNYDSYSGYGSVPGGDPSSWSSTASETYTNYDSYGGYANYGHYESNWVCGSTTAVAVESVVNVPGKKGRNNVPREIVEVKQDELMKNRPREDQAKLTGIAFGPSYQPVSTKGKPSKLLKRKHQIGSLYYDMKQKESELAERRARGFLTKAETQAKYGW